MDAGYDIDAGQPDDDENEVDYQQVEEAQQDEEGAGQDYDAPIYNVQEMNVYGDEQEDDMHDD